MNGSNQITPYGEPPADCKDECETLCKGRTISELNQLSAFFSIKASQMRDIAENDLTMEDFEKAKKSSTTTIPTMNEGKFDE
jgi:hypothetical protein